MTCRISSGTLVSPRRGAALMMAVAVMAAIPATAAGRGAKAADIQNLRLWTENLFALRERFARFCDSLPEARKMGMDRIVAFEENRDFVYVLGPVRSWMRRFVFLKPGVFVVDDLGKPPSSGPVLWRVHTRAAPEIQGVQIRFAGADAKLRGQCILPGGATVTSRAEPYGDHKAAHVIAVGRTSKSTPGRYVHVFYTAGETPTQIRATQASKEGPLQLTVSCGEQTFELALPPQPVAAGTIAVSAAGGKALLARRLLPSGIMPHGPKGVALLERWDKPYRSARMPGWDAGRVANELKKAVEGGTIRPGRALVLGCGSGTNAIYLAGKGFDVTGLDVAPTALTVARRKADKAGARVRWIVADAAAAPELKPFDFLFDRGCYHHVRGQNAAGYVKMVSELTRPGGRLLLLAFRATKGSRASVTRITESQLRGDFSAAFDFQWLREMRFDTRSGTAKGSAAWSVLLKRKQEAGVGKN